MAKEKMRICGLFSGGKDSVMAVYRAMEEHDVAVLLSMVPESDESYMYHVPNIRLASYCAEAMEIPIVFRETSGKPPQENVDLKEALSDLKAEHGITGVCAGAVASSYQFNIVAGICQELGLEVYTPYWKKPHEELIRDALDAGFEIVFVGVAADGLDESWLGRLLDYAALKELKRLAKKHGLDVGGEGGEYETFVVDAPMYKKRIEIKKSRKTWDGVRGHLIIEEAELAGKG